MAAASLGWLVVLSAAPVALWHRALADILSSFHWNLGYAATELTPWGLMLAGVAFMVPVAVSAGRNSESRLYPRRRRSYFVWGVVLYMLGAVMAVEVVDVWHYTR